MYLYTYGYINKEQAVRALHEKKNHFCIQNVALLKSFILYSM